MNSKLKKIIVGMSGGVDSSVTALLLQQQGYQVQGVFMQNWEEDLSGDPFCSTSQDLKDVEAVCSLLNIPFHTVHFAQEYWNRVFQHFLDEYAAGRTPNPDILCNQEIKFKAFLDYAMAQGADYIATGHYARIHGDKDQFYLLKGRDLSKDQSYFLYTLQQSQLARSLFPLGELTKPDVRQLARDAGLVNHAKKDSTGICFIGERKFRNFLSEYLLARPGAIETLDGEVLGKHDGLMFYTLGQRQGLGIGGRRQAQPAPWYVIDKDRARNVLVVGQSHDHPKLLNRFLQCRQLKWVGGSPPQFPLHCAAKTRYRQLEAACVVRELGDNCEVEFDQPQWAITPGQSVVFYQNEICLGGGVIE
jgi:tRNA-uridine 2-sulfurtransferase